MYININNRRTSYQNDDINLCMDVGKQRQYQEDAIVVAKHLQNETVQLLGIADGMGGLEQGHKASTLATQQLYKWFQKIRIDYLNSYDYIAEEIVKICFDIDQRIKEELANSGTTLTFSILTEQKSIIAQVGDSRAYIALDGKLEQIGRDHSKSWELYEQGVIPDKDALRYHKKNHLITSGLGSKNKQLITDIHVLSKYDMDSLLLFTDGVTDCLSESTIQDVVTNNNVCAEMLVDLALETLSERYDLNSEEYYNIINGGKDNTSAIVYQKKRR